MLLKSLLIGDDAAYDATSDYDTDEAGIENQSEFLLIRSFVKEVHTVALLTSGAASAVNYARKFSTPDPLLEARALISGYQSNIANWPHRVLAAELSYDTIQSMADLDKALRLGGAELLNFEIDSGGIGIHRAFPLYISKLSSTWHRTARIAVELVESLRDELIPIFSDDYTPAADQLIKILSRVIDGNPECCGSDGKIILPQLAERRNGARHEFLQAALVRVGTTDHKAIATDISYGGIGLRRMPTLTSGTPVHITLACGRTFTGTVAWSRGDLAGVAFNQQLSPTDPLIFG